MESTPAPPSMVCCRDLLCQWIPRMTAAAVCHPQSSLVLYFYFISEQCYVFHITLNFQMQTLIFLIIPHLVPPKRVVILPAHTDWLACTGKALGQLGTNPAGTRMGEAGGARSHMVSRGGTEK